MTTGYLRGESSQTVLVYQRSKNKVTVTLSPSKGSYAGQPEERSYLLELRETARPRDAAVRPGRFETNYLMDYDESTHTVRVRIPPRPIHDELTVSVDF